jgi:oligosaccharide repeat unit polymerase
VTFTAGSYLATYEYRRPEILPAPSMIPGKGMANVLLIVSCVGLIFFIQRARYLAAQGPFDSFLVNVRWVTGGNTFADEDPLESFGLVSYLVSLSVIAVAVQFFLVPHYKSRWRYYLSVLVAFVYAVLSTGRTFVMIVAMLILGLNLISGRMKFRRGLAYLLGFGLVSFTAIGIVLGKGGELSPQVIVDQFRIYLLGGLAAFGQYIQSAGDLQWGVNVFRSPLAAMRALGVDTKVPDLMKEYRYVPDPTNVYTFYRPYFDDYGYIGVFVAPFFFGALHGRLYKFARNGSTVGMIFFALTLFPLFMQFFQDQYFSLLSTWLQYGLWVAFAFIAARVIRRAEETDALPIPASQ